MTSTSEGKGGGWLTDHTRGLFEAILTPDALVRLDSVDHVPRSPKMTDERAANLYLSLGMIAGTLMDAATMGDFIQAMRTRDLNPYYVRMVRDQLTKAIEDATDPDERL